MTSPHSLLSVAVSVALLLLLQLTMVIVHAVATAADIANFRGAILVKNGIPTSCELALIDNQAAFVAANCLDYKSGQVSADTKYEVYFDGAKGNAPGRATINPGDIYVNGFYDPTSYANNVAVVKFDFSAQGAWRNFFAVNRLEWNNIAYVRRQLLNAAEDSMATAWSTPAVMSQLNSDPGCAKASGLFSSNQDDMLCSKQSVASPVSDRCSLPYGSLYGVASRAMAVSALYSHTVSYGNKVCNNGDGGDTYHFYTQLSNYTRFARNVLGRKLSEYIENADQYSELRHITSYRMRYPESDNDQGTSMFGGDIFAVQRMELNLKPPQQMQPPSLPPPPPPPPPPPANTATTTATTTATKPQAEQGQATSPHTSSSPSLPATATRPDDAAAGASKDASSIATPSTSKENNVSDRSTSLIDPADFPPGFGTGGVTRVDYDDDDDGKHDNSSKHSSESTSQSTSAEQNKAGGQSNDGDGFKGVSKSTAIALAVTIPLLVIMASVGSYFMYKSHRKRKFNILQSNELNL